MPTGLRCRAQQHLLLMQQQELLWLTLRSLIWRLLEAQPSPAPPG